MTYVSSSFLDKKLSPLERVYRMWYSVFSVRLWRLSILQDEEYTLAVNYLSLNNYLSIEINAHGLVLLILQCQDRPEELQPWDNTSQPCESHFRFDFLCKL